MIDHQAGATSEGASLSHRCSAKPRTVVMSMGLIRIPVSVSMRLRSSRLPSESRPYSDKRTVRIEGAAQNQADLLGHQTPEPSGPLVQRQRVQLGAEFACVRSALPRGLEQFSEPAALREGGQPRCSH